MKRISLFVFVLLLNFVGHSQTIDSIDTQSNYELQEDEVVSPLVNVNLVGEWEIIQYPDFKGTIDHVVIIEFVFYLNESGYIDGIHWTHSALTPAEKNIIQKKFIKEFKVVPTGKPRRSKGVCKVKLS